MFPAESNTCTLSKLYVVSAVIAWFKEKTPEEFNIAVCIIPPLIVYSIFASGDPVNVVTTLSPEQIC